MKFPIVSYIFIKMFRYNYSCVTVHYHFHIKLSNSFSIDLEYSREPSDNYTRTDLNSAPFQRIEWKPSIYSDKTASRQPLLPVENIPNDTWKYCRNTIQVKPM